MTKSFALFLSVFGLVAASTGAYANPDRPIGFRVVGPNDEVVNIGGEADGAASEYLATAFQARAEQDGHKDYFRYFFECQSSHASQSGAACTVRDLTDGLGFKVTHDLGADASGKLFMLLNGALGHVVTEGELECVYGRHDADCEFSHLHFVE